VEVYDSKNGIRRHWTGDDGRVHEVIFQGKYLKWRVHQPPSNVKQTTKRQPIVEFSKASRLRLLCVFNQVDWRAATPALFITLTYPDNVECRKRKTLNTHRYVFWRSLEKKMGRHIPAIWRLEWKVRLTGELVGEPMPHWHMLAFKEPFIHHDQINYLWQKAIGHEGYVRTETERMRNQRQAGYYISKYLAKVDPSLVIAAYHNKLPTGRQWGILRKSLLPLMPEHRVRLPPGDVVNAARQYAALERPEVNTYGNESFTLLGEKAIAVGEYLFGKGVDRGRARG